MFAGALVAGGLDARVVSANADLYDWSVGHTLVEVWIPELGHWVLMDSMADVTYCVDGRPASLLDVYDAVNEGDVGRITFDRSGADIKLPILGCRNCVVGLFTIFSTSPLMRISMDIM